MSVRLLVNREVNTSRNYNLSSSIRSCIINCQVECCGESNINHWKLTIGESNIGESWYSLLRCDENGKRKVFSTAQFEYYAWIFGDSFFQTPVQGGRVGERRASSPFQNGQTEVLIGEVEGGPRSPRGSTSSTVNDANFLGPPDERDGNKPICRRVTTAKSLRLFPIPNFHLPSNLKIKPTRISPIFETRCSCLRLFPYYIYIVNSRGERNRQENARICRSSLQLASSCTYAAVVASSMRWKLGRLLLDVAVNVLRARNLRYREIQQKTATRTFFISFFHLYSFSLRL